MPVILTDAEDLARLVREAVREAVCEELPRLVQKATEKQLLTKDDLKQETGWSDRRIQYLLDTKQLPFVAHGRSFLYPREGLDEYARRNTVRAKVRPTQAPQ